MVNKVTERQKLKGCFGIKSRRHEKVLMKKRTKLIIRARGFMTAATGIGIREQSSG